MEKVFEEKRGILKEKGLNIDELHNIENAGIFDFFIEDIKKYEDTDNQKYMKIYIFNFLYYIYINIKTFTEYFMYQINTIYNKDYSYYELLLFICFITLILITIIILYWDYIYREAMKKSACKNIKNIINENFNQENPFVYVVMIIHKNNINKIYDKYIVKIEYNFNKNTTKIIYGERKYLEENNVYIDAIPDSQFNSFNYYDINESRNKKIDNLDSSIITNKDYRYITITTKGKSIKSDTALELAKFTKKYASDTTIVAKIIHDIVLAKKEYDTYNQ